jgi:tryptophanyl-tRNA synthetase
MMRDEASKVKCPKPSAIYGQFLPSLTGGIDGKMSSSLPASCIFLSDTSGQVKKKLGKSFSGGQETMEMHRELGGDCDVDVAYQMLHFFLDDDQRLDEIRQVCVFGIGLFDDCLCDVFRSTRVGR